MKVIININTGSDLFIDYIIIANASVQSGQERTTQNDTKTQHKSKQNEE